jgi:hypothetical protein
MQQRFITPLFAEEYAAKFVKHCNQARTLCLNIATCVTNKAIMNSHSNEEMWLFLESIPKTGSVGSQIYMDMVNECVKQESKASPH